MYLPLYKVADTPFHIQEDDVFIEISHTLILILLGSFVSILSSSQAGQAMKNIYNCEKIYITQVDLFELLNVENMGGNLLRSTIQYFINYKVETKKNTINNNVTFSTLHILKPKPSFVFHGRDV